jgi:cytochrome bd ubiquinol oxidase subunit I
VHLDVAVLARIQFALTIMFHYIFPPLSIGLGGLLVSLEWKFLRTHDRQYEMAAKFWTKIFAIVFAIGVATGITMEFQFGTNWATYSRYVGDVFGSALAAEGIFAFFLESGFLAVLVFGWDKVTAKMHFFASCMVALGAIFSSIWIVVANSWQQTPAGFHIVNGRAEITDFWAMVFNPSSIHRLVHVWIGAYIVGGFFVMSIAAYYLLRNRHVEFARKSFLSALTIATLAALAALVSGDLQGRNVAKTQPAKLAAMEGHFKTGGPTPLYLFGFPDEQAQRVNGGVAIPGLLSLMVNGNMQQPVGGLDKIPQQDWPPVAITFQTFHLMVMLGMWFIGLTLLANFYRWRGTLFTKRWLLWTFVWIVPLPFAANQLGWVTAEVGRQPWVVYGLLRTSDALSKSVVAGQVLGSIIMFMVIYALLFAAFLFILNSKIQQGPEEVSAAPEHTTGAGWIKLAAQRSGAGGESLTREDTSHEH